MNPHLIQQAIERTLVALTIATTKPSPRGDNGGGGGAIEPPLPLPVGIISAKRELRDILLLWVDLVSDGMDVVAHCDPTDTSMLEWLAGNERATFLAAHDAAGDFLDELTTITKSLESPYLPRNGYKYIGNVAGSPLYAKDGQKEVTLPDGETMTVQAAKEHAANNLLNYEGTAEKVALIISEYFGHAITPRQVSEAQRNDKRKEGGRKLEPIRTDGRTHIYTVFDVLERLCKNK